MRHHCRVTASRMALRYCDEESSRGFARAAPRRARWCERAILYNLRRGAALGRGAGSVTFPSRCLLSFEGCLPSEGGGKRWCPGCAALLSATPLM